MDNKRNVFYNIIHDYTSLNIFVSDGSTLEVIGSRIIHLMNGKINIVLYVHCLSANMLLIFQITHLDDGKSIDFWPCGVLI